MQDGGRVRRGVRRPGAGFVGGRQPFSIKEPGVGPEALPGGHKGSDGTASTAAGRTGAGRGHPFACARPPARPSRQRPRGGVASARSQSAPDRSVVGPRSNISRPPERIEIRAGEKGPVPAPSRICSTLCRLDCPMGVRNTGRSVRSGQRQEANCPRGVGPLRAGHFGLRALVEVTGARNALAQAGPLALGQTQ
jgi:hypothetical protein